MDLPNKCANVFRLSDLGRLRVVAGEHSLSTDSGLEQISAVSNIYLHQGFDDITYENDIALIFVSSFFM